MDRQTDSYTDRQTDSLPSVPLTSLTCFSVGANPRALDTGPNCSISIFPEPFLSNILKHSFASAKLKNI